MGIGDLLRRGGLAALFVAAGAFVVLGCGTEEESGGEQGASEEETLVVALPGEPENLNPIFGDVYEGNWKVFNGLLRYEQDLTPAPDLAAGMPETSDDGQTVTVSLRDDVEFHDGEPLRAEDVVFTYESILQEEVATGLRTLFDSLEEVRAVDEGTVEFSLNRPDPAFMDKLQVGVVPERLLEGEDLNTADYNQEPVGTGPYRFEEWAPGERIVLEANPDYFEEPASIPRVVFTFIEDENARAAALEDGSVDAAGLVPSVAPRFEDAEGFELHEIPSADARTVALPHEEPVLEEEEVRQALSVAVDREAMVEGVLRGYGEPAYGPIAEDHWAYDPEVEVEHDPAEAERLLEEAGWEDTNGDGIRQRDGEPLSFTVMYPAGDSVRRDAALALSSDLEEVGVNAEVDGPGWDAIEPRIGEDGTVFGYGVPYDPDLELYNLFHSSFSDDDDPFTNAADLQDPQIDAALDEARSTMDQQEREEAYSQLQQELAEDGSWLYMVRLTHIVVTSDRVEGIDPQTQPHAHGFSRGVSWNLERWELEG